ncbi:MaoC family dehydratase [Plastoroseomonas hellenica]|uniref:Dehydratase n=1 Tax=Plastoroseomonas hellenica TaxID=2687306 RepID=A0ABS5F2H7_9PROT|nr:MaoC/PaaZ C-terminal domain-containing protein [Plastoroseomonas hellenica]MBR0642945.1 dehydratase [Plastoroseomonas hellenica]MBR0666668.1 dehydratase [Plastoroseomonas hellenica]
MPSLTGLAIGDSVEFRRGLSAEDIAAFAALSGDDDPVHVDEEFAAGTAFGRCIAHGAHVMALVSAASSQMSRRAVRQGCAGTPVSAGYDRIRFLHPVFAGDALTAHYRIEAVEEEPVRTRSRFEVTNQDGVLCVVGTHILRFVPA